jgi:hypothetical protein
MTINSQKQSALSENVTNQNQLLPVSEEQNLMHNSNLASNLT